MVWICTEVFRVYLKVLTGIIQERLRKLMRILRTGGRFDQDSKRICYCSVSVMFWFIRKPVVIHRSFFSVGEFFVRRRVEMGQVGSSVCKDSTDSYRRNCKKTRKDLMEAGRAEFT
jgi:hypothetical protein